MSYNHATTSTSTSASTSSVSKSWWPLRSPQKEHAHSFDLDTHHHSHKSSPGGLKSLTSAFSLGKSRKQHQHLHLHDPSSSSSSSSSPSPSYGTSSSRPALASLATQAHHSSGGTATNGASASRSASASVPSTNNSSRITGRPPSHSVSSTARSESLDEDPVPKTPLDGPRNSMMTLADDPFAAGAIVTTPRSELGEQPHSMSMNMNMNSRLSAYSNHSTPESVMHHHHHNKNPPHSPLLFGGGNGNSERDSYASTSSSSAQREYRSNTSSPRIPGWSRLDQSTTPGSTRTRVASFGAQEAPRTNDSSSSSNVTAQGSYGTNFASSSSSTLSDKNRLSQPAMASMQARPAMRARGMTDVGPGQTMVQFLRDDAGPGPSGSGSNANRPASSRSAQAHTQAQSTHLSPHLSPHGANPPVVAPSLSRTSSRMNSPTTEAPRLVVRQASVSRHPPSAPPPTLGLPPTPGMAQQGQGQGQQLQQHDLYSPVAPLSTLRSSHSARRSPVIPEDPSSSGRPSALTHAHTHAHTPGDLSHTHHLYNGNGKVLKKAASQSSLKAASFNVSSPKLMAAEDNSIAKAPRKQRSFNSRPKSPVPLVPALPPLCSPPLSPAILPVDGAGGSGAAGKRGSVSSRKRLFSGGSIRTVSSALPGEDSYELEPPGSSASAYHRAPPGYHSQQQQHPYPHSQQPSTNSSSNSFWEEEQVLPPSPVTHQHEYTPQQIMSPAEMLKVEASHNRGSVYSYGRDRAHSRASVNSVSTTRTDMSVVTLGSQVHHHHGGHNALANGHGHGHAGSGVHRVSSPAQQTTQNGSPSLLHPTTHHMPVQQQQHHDAHHPHHPHQHPHHPHHHALRPHRTDDRLTPTPSYSPAPPEINSLPPPPRRRANSRPSTSSSLASVSSPITSTNHSLSFSLSRAASSASYRTTGSTGKRSEEYSNYRKSILRKASFLDIGDEMERSEEEDERVGAAVGAGGGGPGGGGDPDSFLDLRPSIDSVRSVEAHS